MRANNSAWVRRTEKRSKVFWKSWKLAPWLKNGTGRISVWEYVRQGRCRRTKCSLSTDFGQNTELHSNGTTDVSFGGTTIGLFARASGVQAEVKFGTGIYVGEDSGLSFTTQDSNTNIDARNQMSREIGGQSEVRRANIDLEGYSKYVSREKCMDI